jgi:hypothetical protein
MVEIDPRTIEVSGLRRAGEYVGLSTERMRQLCRNDPLFPKPTQRTTRPKVSWSAAQLDGYKALRAARQLWDEKARVRIDSFRVAEAEGMAGERLDKDLVTADGLYKIGGRWGVFFRGQQIVGGIESRVDAQITLEHLRRQEAVFGPSPAEQDELAEFLAAKVPEAEPAPSWMAHHEGRAVGQGLPLTGSSEELWGVAWLPQIPEIFAVRMTGPPGPKSIHDVRSTILLSDLPVSLDRTSADGLFHELCECPVARDPCVGLPFLRKALAICFPRQGESPSRACCFDPVADLVWLPFDPLSAPIGSVETNWGLIDFAADHSGQVGKTPRSVEVRHATQQLPATVLARIPSVPASR